MIHNIVFLKVEHVKKEVDRLYSYLWWVHWQARDAVLQNIVKLILFFIFH